MTLPDQLDKQGIIIDIKENYYINVKGYEKMMKRPE